MSKLSFLFVCALMSLHALSSDKDMQMTISVKLSDNEKVTMPVISSPVVQTQSKPAESLPPPEPSASDAADPRRLVRYFCRMWKDEEYEKMYWAMTPKYRKAMTLKKFSALFESDAERTGGLKDENIVIDDVDEGKNYIITVDLRFNFIRAKDRRVKAVLEKGKLGYRIKASGIIPLDLNDL